MDVIDKLLAGKSISQLGIREQEKARQILKVLEGSSICKAQDVLDACKAALSEIRIKL